MDIVYLNELKGFIFYVFFFILAELNLKKALINKLVFIIPLNEIIDKKR